MIKRRVKQLEHQLGINQQEWVVAELDYHKSEQERKQMAQYLIADYVAQGGNPKARFVFTRGYGKSQILTTFIAQ
jgi:hypothetical protein